MLFNLKEAAEHGVNVGTNWSSQWHTTMRFEEPAIEDDGWVPCISLHLRMVALTASTLSRSTDIGAQQTIELRDAEQLNLTEVND